MTLQKLFSPVKVGKTALQHRVVMAPLTRFRAERSHVPTALMAEYYAQRASTPGTLIISEGTFIAPQAGGLFHVPEIYTNEQIVAWKRVCNSPPDSLRMSCELTSRIRLQMQSMLEVVSSTSR